MTQNRIVQALAGFSIAISMLAMHNNAVTAQILSQSQQLTDEELAKIVPFANGQRGSFPGCPKCGVFSYVDYPADEQTVSLSNFVIAGWGFECVGGAPADRVDIWYQDYNGYWQPLAQADWALFYGAVPRPDVQNAYRGECPNVPLNSGWHLVITNPPPKGLRRLSIKVWYGPYFNSHRRTYLITQ